MDSRHHKTNMAILRRASESFIVLLVAFATLSIAAQSGRQKPQPTPTPDDDPVRIETEEVKVNLLAFDEHGNFFRDVRAEDVVITENNVLHQATSLRRIPANVVIVLDTGGELRAVKTLDQTRKVAQAVVMSLRDGDNIAVIQYADDANVISEWSQDKQRALAAIKRTKFGRRSAFDEALSLATDMLSREGVENKHLVVITDGTDSETSMSMRNDAIRRILSTDIAVHVISYTRMEIADIEPRTKMISKEPPPKAMPDEIAATLPNGARDNAQAPKIGPTINMDRTLLKKMRARQAELERSEEVLSTLAENTNGTLIIPETLEEMELKAATVAKMIDASYVLTYMPKVPFGERGGERNISVTSKRPGLVVQANRKFIVPPRKG